MQYRNVFIIGVDGAGDAVFHTECPNIKRVEAWGGKLSHARTVYPTISAQCWGSLLLAVRPEMHRYDNDLVTDTKAFLNSPYKTIYSLIKENYPDWETASFSSWEAINIGIIEDLPEIKKVSLPDDRIADACAEYIRNSGNGAVFLQLDDVDHMGHTHGYRSDAYYKQMRQADTYLGKIFDAIEDSGKRADSLIFVVSDHGGGGADLYQHGSMEDEDMNIFILSYDGHEEKEERFQGKNIMDIVPYILRKLEIKIPEYCGDHDSKN